MDIKCIVFDVGWTLVDEVDAHIARIERLRKVSPLGARFSVDELMALYGAAITEFDQEPLRRVIEKCGLDTLDRTLYPYGKMAEKPYPDAQSALRKLSGRHVLGTLANQSTGLKENLDRMGLGEHLTFVLGSGDVGMKKPDPRFFSMAQEKSGFAPADLLMVGDRVDYDVAPAKAAGWHTARILRGMHRHQKPRNAGETPDIEVQDLEELAERFT